MNKIHDSSIGNTDLNLIYAYYCRLNPHKMKHKHFDELTVKNEAMDLHQFMTFCKDVSLNAKRKKNHVLATQQQLLQLSSSKPEKQKQRTQKREEREQVQNHLNATGQNNKQTVLEKRSTYKSKKEGKSKIKPNVYLDQRKIAQLFKKYSSPEGEINFEGFNNVLKSIAQQMYRQKQNQNKSKDIKEIELLLQTKQQSSNSMHLLLQFLKIDTKQHVLQFYKKVNQLHGNLQHLKLLITPVKKVRVKNDPLGKYAGKENTSHSRLIQTINSRKKIIKKNEKTLPSLKKEDKSSYIAALINTNTKSTEYLPKHADILTFLKKHQSEIELINKTYENGSIVRVQQQSKDLSVEQQILAKSKTKLKVLEPEKKQKKYSQRHKNKIMGEAARSELGKLIDVTDLYNDQIFNKYLQINHSPKNKTNSPTFLNSKHYHYK